VLQVRAHERLGWAQAAGHRYPEAEASYREALDLLGRLHADRISRDLSAVIRLGLAKVLEATRPDEAREPCRQAIEVLEQLAQEWPLTTGVWDLLFEGYEQLAQLAARAGRDDEVNACHRRALDALGRFVDKLPPEQAYEDLALAVFASFSGQLKLPGERVEWEPLYRGSLAVAERLAVKFPGRPGPQSRIAVWQATLGSVLTARNRPAEAGDAYRQALAGYEAVLNLDPSRVQNLNNLAWLLATCPISQFRDPPRAVELARKATELAPQYAYLWNTRGVAHYRAGDWDAAIAALEKSMALYRPRAQRSERLMLESFSTFFLAMAHARLEHGALARSWYDRAVAWMEQYQPDDLELQRFRREAEELLGMKKS
jgi:tetratricopeptide (TPR) repeat protein